MWALDERPLADGRAHGFSKPGTLPACAPFDLPIELCSLNMISVIGLITTKDDLRVINDPDSISEIDRDSLREFHRPADMVGDLLKTLSKKAKMTTGFATAKGGAFG